MPQLPSIVLLCRFVQSLRLCRIFPFRPDQPFLMVSYHTCCAAAQAGTMSLYQYLRYALIMEECLREELSYYCVWNPRHFRQIHSHTGTLR